MFEGVKSMLGHGPGKSTTTNEKPKKSFSLSDWFGWDDKVFRLAGDVVMWCALVAIVWIIFG